MRPHSHYHHHRYNLHRSSQVTKQSSVVVKGTTKLLLLHLLFCLAQLTECYWMILSNWKFNGAENLLHSQVIFHLTIFQCTSSSSSFLGIDAIQYFSLFAHWDYRHLYIFKDKRIPGKSTRRRNTNEIQFFKSQIDCGTFPLINIEISFHLIAVLPSAQIHCTIVFYFSGNLFITSARLECEWRMK